MQIVQYLTNIDDDDEHLGMQDLFLNLVIFQHRQLELLTSILKCCSGLACMQKITIVSN